MERRKVAFACKGEIGELMKIKVNCKCGASFATKKENVGRRAKCSKCGEILTVEGELASLEPVTSEVPTIGHELVEKPPGHDHGGRVTAAGVVATTPRRPSKNEKFLWPVVGALCVLASGLIVTGCIMALGSVAEGEPASPPKTELTLNHYSYIVPDSISSLPAYFTPVTLSGYSYAINRLPFADAKGKFEKTVDFKERMKAIWPNATLFGRPATSRQIVVGSANARYDADTEIVTVPLRPPIASRETHSDGKVYVEKVSLANIHLPSTAISWGLAPEEAMKALDQLRLAYVIRFGPHPNNENFSPRKWRHDKNNQRYDGATEWVREL